MVGLQASSSVLSKTSVWATELELSWCGHFRMFTTVRKTNFLGVLFDTELWNVSKPMQTTDESFGAMKTRACKTIMTISDDGQIK